jgi:hypothetical protein
VKANEGGENSACAANSSLRGKPEDATAREHASKKEHPTVTWRTLIAQSKTVAENGGGVGGGGV